MMLRMMKKSRAVMTLICVGMVMMLATGCGEEKEAPIPVDLSSEKGDEQENLVQDVGENSLADSAEEGDNAQAQQPSGMDELDGNVTSVGQDSFVICKETTSSDGDSDLAVAPAPGAETAEDLVTVYVNQNCSYQYETVKNGGINPEDISAREGSFGDLKDGLSCNIKGSWKDGSFYADSIKMMEFV